MTLSFAVSDHFREAAAEWGDQRLLDPEDALEEKLEQALLEIEHLVADATNAEFTVADGTVHHEPSPELAAFLEAQAARTRLDEATLLGLHVDLFARVFLDSDQGRPPGAPPT